MVPEGERPSWVRKHWWWLLIAAAVVYLAAFDWLADRFRPEPATSQTASKGVSPPTVRRLDGGGIEIRYDLFRRTTVRLHDESEEKTLFDCLERGFAEAFGSGTERWTPARMRAEAKRVQDDCLAGGVLDLPELPVLPPPSDSND